jgi:REP element-mobilizing transposase RayT
MFRDHDFTGWQFNYSNAATGSSTHSLNKLPDTGKYPAQADNFSNVPERGWVIMPNHVHLLLRVGDTPLSKIVKELKRYTVRKANKTLRQKGAFWTEDYFDTYMRDPEQGLKTR